MSEQTHAQKAMILEHFLQGKTLTQAEAYDRYGCFRLSARIREIELMGYTVERCRECAQNRYGKQVYYTRYYIPGQEAINAVT